MLRSTRRRRVGIILLLVLLLLVAGALGWCRWVYFQIEYYATHDQAEPSDAIAVLGAAEYDGTSAASLRSSSPWAAPAATSSPRAALDRST